jgi:hypothetical protein
VNGFRCVHCGSARPPKSFPDSKDPYNTALVSFLFLVSALTCGLFFPFAVPLYYLLVRRAHRCRDCGIRISP